MVSNKEKVIAAATELFHRQGFQATGLEQILLRSGVCKSNFYYHFKGKDELGEQAIDYQIGVMTETIIASTLDRAELDAPARIDAFFAAMIAYCEKYNCERGCLFGNMALELGEQHEAMRRKLNDFFRGLEIKVATVLSEGAAAGTLTLRGLAPHEAASAIVSLLQGGILLAKGRQDGAAMHNSLKLLRHYFEI